MGGLSRTVTQDTELRGRQLKKGERVLLMFNSANFDSDRFECPEEVRLDRVNARQNLAFGAGPHRCLGAVLGMGEVGIIIRAVLKRLPDYRVDRDRARTSAAHGRREQLACNADSLYAGAAAEACLSRSHIRQKAQS